MALHFLHTGAASAEIGDLLTLTGAEAHHAATVRRVRVGERVTVGDGCGVWLGGVCASAGARELVIRVDSREEFGSLTPRIVLVQALAKGDRDELAVQAATELGVDEIVPWQASRSISRWEGAKAEKGRGRWESIVREAAKQSHRAWVPGVTELRTTEDLAALATTTRMLVLEPTAENRLVGVDLAGAGVDQGDAGDLVLVVGPEGGIAEDELTRLVAAGARCVRLGDTVLRTSTAGPSALAVLNSMLGRW